MGVDVTEPRPCALSGPKVWGDEAQCARCLAKRFFRYGASIVPSVQCPAAVARIPLPADDLEAWRRLGNRRPESETVANGKN